MPEDHPRTKPDDTRPDSAEKPDSSDRDRHRLTQFAGIGKDHPDLDEFVENVAEDRRSA